MAYDAAASAVYSGRPAFYLYLYLRRDQTDVANNRSSYAWELLAVNDERRTQTYALDCFGWSVNIGGQIFSGCHGLDFRSGTRTISLGTGTTGWFNHDSSGYLNLYFSAGHYNASIFGTAQTGSTLFQTDRIPKAPAAAGWISATNVGLDRMTINWGMSTNDNGAGIDAYLLRRADNPQFNNYVDTLHSSTTFSSTVTGLTPGQTYYWRVYAHNAIGFAPPTSTLAQATIPSGPPGLAVSPAISGRQATLNLYAPGGVSGVSKYLIQRRLNGTTTPVTSLETTGSVYVDVGLTPGSSYQWRAAAVIGSYTSPYTAWVTANMPNPNTSAGEYFDGDTAATPNATYAWLGTADNSRSVARGFAPAGWMAYDADNPTGSTGVVSRAVGGLFGSYCAQVSIQTSPTALGLAMGISAAGAAEVEAGALYWGSIHLYAGSAHYPGVFQSGIRWYNAANAVISTTWGEVVQNPSFTQNFRWVRYSTSGIAPAGAVKAAPVIRDAGTVEKPFILAAGYRFLLDGAMISLTDLYDYFDGSTVDVPGYDYQWLGTVNNSPSIRYRVPITDNDPLNDPDCASVPAPPSPPTIPSDCIEDVGEWRRYVVQVPASEVHIWTATLPTLVLRTATEAERQVRIRFFPNPEGLPPQQLDTETPEGELILSYVPPNTVLTLDGVARRVWAEVNGSESIPANQLLYGTGGAPATWPEMSCGVEYLIALDVPVEAPSGNLTTTLSLTPRV